MFGKKYDIMVVGAGLYGSTYARIAAEAGKKVLLLEKSPYVSGHTYTKNIEGIPVHVFGPHYFHTNNKRIWDWINQFGEFNSYQAKVKAMHKGSIYSLPFNMMTFYQLWGCVTPSEARQKIKEQQIKIDHEPRNLEEWALSVVGKDIYNVLIYGYTKKQWQKEPRQLPASILRRIPIRYTYDDNYHTARYAGVPVEGYTKLVENILDHENITLEIKTDFFNIPKWQKLAKQLVYSGPIDQFFGYKYGMLEYRSLEFKHVVTDGDFQGAGQINYTEEGIPYTRISEHKHFYPDSTFGEKSVISFEYPKAWTEGMERFYPVNTNKNKDTYSKYSALAKETPNVTIGGRLGTYKYFDMDMVIGQAMKDVNRNI